MYDLYFHGRWIKYSLLNWCPRIFFTCLKKGTVIYIVFNGKNLLAFKFKPIIQNELNIRHNVKKNIAFSTIKCQVFHSSEYRRVVSDVMKYIQLHFKLNLRRQSKEFLPIYCWYIFKLIHNSKLRSKDCFFNNYFCSDFVC